MTNGVIGQAASGAAQPAKMRLVLNTLAQLVTPVVRLSLGIGLTAALTRYLGLTGYGSYALVMAYVGTFTGLFTDWGLLPVVVREVSRYPERRAALLVSASALQLVVAICSYGLALAALPLLRGTAEVRYAAGVYGLTLLLSPIDILSAQFHADLRLARLVLPAVVGSVVSFSLSMLFIALHFGMFWFVFATLCGVVVQYAWLAWLNWTSLGPGWAFSTSHWRLLVREAWPIGLGTTFKVAWQQAPLLILSSYSLEAVALFNVASKIPQQLLVIPLSVNGTMFPVLSRLWLNDRQRFQGTLNVLMIAGFAVAIPMIVLGAGFARMAVVFLFGTAFVGAAEPFAMLLAVTGLLFPGILMAETLNAAGFQRAALSILMVFSPMVLVLLLAMIPRGGATGAAAALLLCYGLYVPAFFVVARWRMGQRASLSTLLWAGVALGLALAAYRAMAPAAGAMMGSMASAALGLCVFVASRQRHIRWAISGGDFPGFRGPVAEPYLL